MSTHARRIVIAAVALALIAALVWWVSRPKPVEVVVKAIDRGTVEQTVANTRAGTVKACRRAGLAPGTGGQINSLPVHEGDVVHTGQILLELWNDDLTAQLRLAQNEAESTRAKADQACVSADVVVREAARQKKMLAQRLTSEEVADRAEGQALAGRAACRAAKSAIAVSDAKVQVAEAALERTRLRAPFDGTVAEVNGELGEFTTPSPVGIPTLPAVDLVDTSCLYVQAPIDEVDAPQVRTGMTARITLDAFSGRSFPGHVRRVAPYVLDLEKQARTVDIEVEFEKPGEVTNLLPGYSADAEVIVTTRNDVVRAPTEAILEGNRVYVFNENEGVLEERKIKTGISNWVYTEVTEGLAPGERVVTTVDREGVADGARVRIEKSKPGAK
jgi:HlyD family secretion protein